MRKRKQTPSGLTAKELAAELHRRGVKPPSRWQLSRWDPLLSRAPTVTTGKPGRPAVRYTPDCVDRLEIILALRRSQRMRLKTIRYELWWHGIDAELPAARELMVRTIEERLGGFGVTRAGSTDPLYVADEVASDLRASWPPRNMIFRLVVRRVGRDYDDVVAGIYALVVFALGGESPWDDDDAEADDQHNLSPRTAVTRLLGFQKAASDALPDGQQLLDEEPNVQELLIELRDAGGFDFRNPAASLRAATDNELAQARTDAHAFGETLPIAARAIEHRFGRDFAGLGIFTVLQRLSERSLRITATLMVLVVRRALGGDGIEQVAKTLQTLRSTFEAYLTIVVHFPQYARFFKADGDEQLQLCPEQVVSRMREDIQQYLDENPEIKKALGA
jgi:hypothetical protein